MGFDPVNLLYSGRIQYPMNHEEIVYDVPAANFLTTNSNDMFLLVCMRGQRVKLLNVYHHCIGQDSNQGHLGVSFCRFTHQTI